MFLKNVRTGNGPAEIIYSHLPGKTELSPFIFYQAFQNWVRQLSKNYLQICSTSVISDRKICLLTVTTMCVCFPSSTLFIAMKTKFLSSVFSVNDHIDLRRVFETSGRLLLAMFQKNVRTGNGPAEIIHPHLSGKTELSSIIMVFPWLASLDTIYCRQYLSNIQNRYSTEPKHCAPLTNSFMNVL